MKKFFVIGNPIEHSLSPKLHNYWIKKNKIDAIYDKKKIDLDDLEKVISEMRNKNITGMNVTVPFKRAVIPFIDELSFEAKKTQSVNTIFTRGDKIFGHNTDIDGFVTAAKKLNYSFAKKKIFILGAGGVVPSLVFALKKLDVSEIIISNRTKEKALDVKKLFPEVNIIDWGNLVDFNVIINATSIGLKKEDKINLNFSKISKNKLFYDIIYNPEETNFLKIGKNLGNLVENGKLMFLYQGLLSFNLWHNMNINLDNDVLGLFSR